MKINLLCRNILLFSTILIISSCEFESYKDFALPAYDGELTWTENIRNAPWKNRYDHAAAVFNNKMWVIGGYNPGEMKGDTYYEDVWSSEDGENWQLENEAAPFKGRTGHSLINFNDGNGEALYLIGGFSVDEETGYRQYNNDVWKSTNGVDWVNIKPTVAKSDSASMANDWYPRKDHQCVVAKHNGTNYIYLIGGFTMLPEISGRHGSIYFNDVWRSADAIHWERLANNDYGIRAKFAAAVDPNTQRIYIQGGLHGIYFEPEEFGSSHPIANWQAVWYSDDGVNWQPEIADSFNQRYLWRSDHSIVYYKNKMWFLPGMTTSEMHYHFTYEEHVALWTIDDQDNWAVDSKGVAFDARHAYQALVFQDKIWIIGGFTNKYGQSNDVWSGTL